jgi:hypothetical protein
MTTSPDRYRWRREPPKEFRWRCGLRTGRWYASERDAGEAAVKAGLACWHGKMLFVGPLVSIESRPNTRAAGTKKAGKA